MSFLKRFFTESEPRVRRRGNRRQAPHLEVGHFSGDAMKFHSIRDISATGVYLLTADRWIPGSTLPLKLQPAGELQEDPRHHVTLHAKAVRCGEDGVGFSFVPPADLDVDSWVALMESSLNQETPDDIVGQFRMAEAVAFLCRIAPSTVAGIRHLMRGELNNEHVANAVEIALKTQELLSTWEDAGALRAHEQIVLHVLEHGSWADEEKVQRLWAGLLAASCMPEPADDSNLFLIDLLSQLAPIHMRIFAAACQKAKITLDEKSQVSVETLDFSQEEVTGISHSRDLVRIERDLFHLSELGLIEHWEKSKTMAVIDRARVTPTRLGLELYARCHGHRGPVAEFFGSRSTPQAA